MCKLYDDIMLQTLDYIDANGQIIDSNHYVSDKEVIVEQTHVTTTIKDMSSSKSQKSGVICNDLIESRAESESGFEDGVVVGGQAGFAGHLQIGKGAKIAGQAGITKNVEAGAFLKGNPALPVQLAHKISVLQRKLPDLFKRIAQDADTI